MFPEFVLRNRIGSNTGKSSYKVLQKGSMFLFTASPVKWLVIPNNQQEKKIIKMEKKKNNLPILPPLGKSVCSTNVTRFTRIIFNVISS